VRLMLKVVMKNDEYFVAVVLLYLFLIPLPVYKFAVLCFVIILNSGQVTELSIRSKTLSAEVVLF
jgi:hypothetical protein